TAILSGLAARILSTVDTAILSGLAARVPPTLGNTLCAPLCTIGIGIGTVALGAVGPVAALGFTAVLTPVGTPLAHILATFAARLGDVDAVVSGRFGRLQPVVAALPLRTAFGALLALGPLCTALLAGRGALAPVSLDAFLPLARLRFGFGGQGSDRHRHGEGAQRAAF
ncbi:hypothetical protein, partial [Erythrobacter aureus]|uniref:hypothetical protein n=1 Tax=Erythrobacter aureus TaxID=2182384 RepID=UPI003A91ADF7